MTTPDTLNPYEQIWQSRDLKALESTPIKLNNKRPEWKKGLNAFVDEMQGTGYGLAALASQGVENVVGPNDITKGITDWGLEGYNRNMEESQAGVNAPKIARVEDVHTASDAMDWASFQLGKGLPMLASLAVPAAIGGTIARFGAKEGVAALAKSAVGDTVKKAVATKALQAAEGDVVTGAMKQAAAKALQDRIAAGAVTGGYLGSFGLEGGQSFGETVAQGVKPEDAVKSAIAVGGINGALEFLPFYSAAKSIGLGQYAKKGIMDIIKSDAGLAKKAVQLAGELGGRAVKGGVVGAGAEGITEGLQELTSIAGERWAKNDPLFADLSEDDWSRVKNSMAAGAITGGVAMGAGATLGGPQKVSTSTDEGQQGGSSGGGVTAPPKTREQEIEELRNKISTELEAAIKGGDTVKAEQLTSARDKLDVAIGREVVPPQDALVDIEAAYEAAHPDHMSLKEMVARSNNVRAELAAAKEAGDTYKYWKLDKLLRQEDRAITTRRVLMHSWAKRNGLAEEIPEQDGATQQEAPIQEPPVQEAPVQQPPAEGITPRPPGQSIQMQRGEEIILTPSGPETRVVPTEEEKVRLQELMGARPEKAPVQDVAQQEVMPNAEEVQAQTEVKAEPQGGGDVKYSMPLNPNQDKKPVTVADVSKIAREPINNVISNITFGEQTLVNKEENVAKRTTVRGKEYNFNLYEYDLQDGRKRLVLSADNPENYVDAGAVIRFENNKPVIEMINADDNFENLGYNLTRQIIKRFGTPVKDESGSFSEIGARHNAKLPQAESIPAVQEASMEEFEAVRKQFQERQKQETPFKNWFGKGVKGITANEDNTPITLYHGTNNPDFNEWDSSRAGDASGHPTSGLGFFMTADKGAAARYGNNLMAVHAKIQNPYTLTNDDLTSIETKEDANKLRKRLMAKGYDGAVVKAPGAKPYVIAFESKQVKFVTNENPTESPDFRYSMPERLPTFYSALARTVEGLSQKKATGEQWVATLDNLVKKGQIKEEEVDWIGVKEWLGEQKDTVSRNDLLKYINDSKVVIEEVELGARGLTAKLDREGNLWEIRDGNGNLLDTVPPYMAENEQEALEYFGSNMPRNTRWTLPGGENQRELVITNSEIASFSKDDTTHYGDIAGGRAIAWVRVNDRIDEDGKKVLFIEEIQSKRHQEGKKKGYMPNDNELSLLEESVNERMDELGIEPGGWVSEEDFRKMPADLQRDWNIIYSPDTVGLAPDAPFKQTISGSATTLSGWAGLAFKRVLRYAAENGYDRIAWTTGEQQAERYNLAKQVNIIQYSDNGRLIAYGLNNEVLLNTPVEEENLGDYIGDELAKKLLERPLSSIGGIKAKRLENTDFKIGGEGMKGFYDRLLPKEIGKYVKKWGAKVGTTEIDTTKDTPETVHSVDITPAMQQSVMQGQPLFSEPSVKEVPTRSVTPVEFRANIDSVMGEGWLAQAESAEIIQVVDGKGTRGEAGSWDGNTFRIYLQSMPVNGSPAGVLLHEGSHAPTFKQILGDNLEGFLSDLDKLAANGNKAAQKAIMHATIASANVLGIKHNLDMGGSKEDFANVQALIEEQKPGLLAEEKLAYFIQYGSETQSGAGFLRRLINAIKAWFAQTQLGQALKAAGIGFELNEGMAVEWAKMSLQRSLDNAQQAAQVREQVVNEAKLMPPSVRLGRALAALDGNYSFADEAVVQNIPETSLDAVRAQYENTDKWMKAPNGKDTNLNERQWLQVRTPEFKEWFGDWEGDSENASKVVDENGEPLAVWHGMPIDNANDFNGIFKGGHKYQRVQGMYFTKSLSEAHKYIKANGEKTGVLYPVFLDIKNPAYREELNKLGHNIDGEQVKNRLETTGFDGVIDDFMGEIAVFNPSQIKSAIANTGEFSSTNPDIRYSIGIQELIDAAWTDPTDSRVEMVNKPGLLQRWRADFIDFFAEIEKKSKTVYDAFTLLRNKKAARLAQSRQEYYLPLLKEIVGSKWTAKQVGDMAAARHHKVDKVNTRLAERASYGYTKELLKALPKTKRKELMAGRVNIKAGKMPDGSVYMVNGIPATMSAVTKQKLMFDLMNKYSQFEITDANGKQALREEWEIFKDAAGGFSDGGVAKGMVRTVDEVLAPASEDQARFDRIMALFDAMNRHALQIREDGGLITADEHARLLMDKSAYAPLKRESYNVNTETMRLFQQAGRGGSKNLGTRAGTAELSEPTNVLQNALALLEASAAAAERNLANQELYKVVNADKAAWKPWFHIATKDEYVTHDEDGFLQEKNSTAVNRADIVLIKDGKKIVIRPNMHNERAMGFVRAANNLDAQELSGPMKVLGMFNNLVRAVNITFSPIFLMMNAIKDPLTAAYNLQATEGAKHTKEIFVKDYFKTYRDSFRMLKKVFMDNNRDRTDADVKWVERYENAGGRTSFIEQLKENDNTWRSFDAQVARRQGNFKHLMAVKDTWIDGIENLNILFENVMRFSTFRVLVQKGMSDTDAARIAQDLTTNFSRRGYKSQALGLWWLFFNASVQGNYQVVRNLIASKRLQALSLGTIAFAVMLDLLGRAIADDWDEIPEWDKERFIIIPVKVGRDYVKIPAPWVYNTLWRTGGLIGEMFSGVKKPQDALLDIASMTATTFNPLGKPGSLAQAISPTAADPFIQILENKDFAGNPIGPEGYPGASKKANSELLWSSTPKGYQSIARFVNEVTGGSATESGGIDLKPGDYQLLAKFLTGSMGRFLTDSTFGFAEDAKKGIEGPKDIPVIREFFSDPYDPLTVQKYHTNIASIYGAHRLEKMYREGPDRDLIKLQEVRNERGEELRMYSQAQDVERQLKSLRVRLKAAQARDDVGREKQLKERMAQVQEQFNAAYKQRVN